MNELINAYQKIGYTGVKTVQTSEGTGYYLTNSAGNGAIYLPPNATQADAVVSMLPGISGVGDGGKPTAQAGIYQYSDYINKNIMSGNVPSNTIVVIGNTTFDSNCIGKAVNTAVNNGLDIKNVGIMTFSGSGKTGMISAANVSSQHPDIDVRVAHCDAYMTDYEQSIIAGNSSTVKTNVENGVTVLSILPVNGKAGWENEQDMYKATNTMAKSGHDSYLITSTANNHGKFRVEFLQSGGLDWLVGKGDINGSSYIKVQKYDEKTGQWIDSDINELTKNGYRVEIGGNTVELLSNTNDASALAKEIKENGGDLSTFAQIYDSSSSGDTLASNLSFVSNAMGDLKSKIVANENFNYKGGDGEAKVVNAMYNAADYYSNTNNKVFSNLSAEADAIYTIANGIFNMDQAASMVAETSLTDGVKGLFDTSNPEIAEGLAKLNSATQSLIDDASALCDASKYEELQGLLDMGDGNIGKLSVSSLSDAVSKVIPSLQDGVTTAQGLKGSLDEFMSGIGAGNILQGGVWDEVLGDLEAYQNILDASIAASEYIQDVVTTAMGMYIDFFSNANKDILSGISSAGCGDFAGAIDGVIGSLSGFHDDEEIDTNNKGILEEAMSAIEKAREEAEKIFEINEKAYAACPPKWVCDECPDGNGGSVACNCRWEPTQGECDTWKRLMDEAQAAMNTCDALKGVINYQLERIATFIQITEQVTNMISDAIDNIRSVFADPVALMQGNVDFKDKFTLDLSKYGIDDSKDYKQLVDDYIENLKAAKEEAAKEEEGEDKDKDKDKGDENPAETPADTTNAAGNTSSGSSGDTSGGPSSPTQQTTPTPTPTQTPTPTPTPSPTQTITETKPEKKKEESTKQEEKKEQTTSPSKQEDKPTDTPPTDDKTSTVDATGKTVIQQPDSRGGNIVRMGADTTPKATLEEEVVGDVVVDNPILEDTVLNDFSEKAIEEPLIETPVTPAEIEQVSTNNDKSIKTMGISAAIGLAVGAAALGAHSIIKSKDDEDVENYDFDK